MARRGIARRDASVFLCLVEVLNDAVAVLIQRFLRYSFHAEYLDLETLSIGKGIFDVAQGLFMYLIQVDGKSYRETVRLSPSRSEES